MPILLLIYGLLMISLVPIGGKLFQSGNVTIGLVTMGVGILGQALFLTGGAFGATRRADEVYLSEHDAIDLSRHIMEQQGVPVTGLAIREGWFRTWLVSRRDHPLWGRYRWRASIGRPEGARKVCLSDVVMVVFLRLPAPGTALDIMNPIIIPRAEWIARTDPDEWWSDAMMDMMVDEPEGHSSIQLICFSGVLGHVIWRHP